MQTLLSEWDSFYVIVGSSAGALIGLQFVAMTLIATRPIKRAAEVGAAFATPTIVHFTAVLFLSALVRAPWSTITTPAMIWGFFGVSGLIYSIVIARRVRKQGAYRPVFEDWLFHTMLPFVTYVLLALSALMAPSHFRESLFGIGTAALLLLFIGIHNSWDAVCYHVWLQTGDSGSEVRREENAGKKHEEKRKRRG